MAEVAKAAPAEPQAQETEPVAQAAEPGGESQGAEAKTPQPTEKIQAGPPRRGPRSVLKVSQVLLRAIDSHKGLTLAALKKELGNAGYQVRRKCSRQSGEAPKSDTKGTLIRVSGSNGSGYFRVWKIPKPRRKPGRPRLEEGGRSARRIPARAPRKRRACRREAKKAGEVRRRSSRANTTVKRPRARAKGDMRSRAKEEPRTKMMDAGRGRTVKEDRPRAREDKRPVEETIQRSTSVKADSRATRPKNP